MARIMKVRTIPRGFVKVEDLGDFVREKNDRIPSEWFMHLYMRFGNYQDEGAWSYMLKNDSILLKATADGDGMDFTVWVSPGEYLRAKRKRTRAMNVIARRFNNEGAVFVPDEGDGILYYAIRKKNEELIARNGMTKKDIKEKMDSLMTENEKAAICGSLSQYMDNAKEEIISMMREVFND